MAQTSQTLGFAFVGTTWVYMQKIIVFAYESGKDFAVLQSAFHEIWARKYCSTLKQDLSYTPTTAFQTFPLPPSEGSTSSLSLESIGDRYHEQRRRIMADRQEGLTATYHRFHDLSESAADIARLRELHVAMDHAVAAAYGWDDLDLGHGFHETAQGIRYTLAEPARRQVLGRLLELNHARYAEEVAAGLHEKKKGRGVQSRAQVEVDEGQLGLF